MDTRGTNGFLCRAGTRGAVLCSSLGHSFTIALLTGTLVAAGTAAGALPQREAPALSGQPQDRPPATFPAPPTRVLDFDPARSIPSLVIEGEKAVTIAVNEQGMTVGPPPGQSWAEFKTQRADAVVVVDVTEVRSFLTQGDSWIDSEVSATVVEVLKRSGTADVGEKDTLSFRERGGSLLVRDTVVTAIVLGSQVAHHQGGRRYVEFLYVNPVTKRLATRESSDSYLINGNRLLSLAGESSLTEAVELEFARIRSVNGLAHR